MIRSVERALDILEFLAREPGRPRSLGEISRHLSLHPATCMNLVRTLSGRGYLEQERPRAGYRPGPMPYCLAGGGRYRPDLLSAARGPLEKLARETGETVLLAVISGRRRYIVLRLDSSREIQVSDEVVRRESESVWRTATGRTLFAWSSPAEKSGFIEAHGLPSPEAWPGACDEAGLERETAAIRRAGRLIMRGASTVALAFPARNARGEVVAALGMPLPSFRFSGPHREKVLGAMRAAAEGISNGHERPEIACRAPDSPGREKKGAR